MFFSTFALDLAPSSSFEVVVLDGTCFPRSRWFVNSPRSTNCVGIRRPCSTFSAPLSGSRDPCNSLYLKDAANAYSVSDGLCHEVVFRRSRLTDCSNISGSGPKRSRICTEVARSSSVVTNSKKNLENMRSLSCSPSMERRRVISGLATSFGSDMILLQHRALMPNIGVRSLSRSHREHST